LAKKVCGDLHQLKVEKASFLFSAAFAKDCVFGHFLNEFATVNYQRPKLGQEEDPKGSNVHHYDHEIDSKDTDQEMFAIL